MSLYIASFLYYRYLIMYELVWAARLRVICIHLHVYSIMCVHDRMVDRFEILYLVCDQVTTYFLILWFAFQYQRWCMITFILIFYTKLFYHLFFAFIRVNTISTRMPLRLCICMETRLVSSPSRTNEVDHSRCVVGFGRPSLSFLYLVLYRDIISIHTRALTR